MMDEDVSRRVVLGGVAGLVVGVAVGTRTAPDPNQGFVGAVAGDPPSATAGWGDHIWVAETAADLPTSVGEQPAVAVTADAGVLLLDESTTAHTRNPNMNARKQTQIQVAQSVSDLETAAELSVALTADEGLVIYTEGD